MKAISTGKVIFPPLKNWTLAAVSDLVIPKENLNQHQTKHTYVHTIWIKNGQYITKRDDMEFSHRTLPREISMETQHQPNTRINTMNDDETSHLSV